jgi:hypothetical protein
LSATTLLAVSQFALHRTMRRRQGQNMSIQIGDRKWLVVL